MSSYIEVRNLKKHFKVPRGMLHAVDDVSFSIEKGKTVGVVGESGCGKSTLGRTIIRLHDATAGHVFFEGQEITRIVGKELKSLRQDIQMIFQDPFSSLDPRMSVSQLISEPLTIYNRCKSKAELAAKVAKLMDTVGLARRLSNVYPHELDGGRRQRIGVARALSLDPSFIVCDEPVSALDVSIQAQILNLMQDLQDERGLTYLFVTHDMAVVKHMSDEIIVMYLGRIVEFASSVSMFNNRLHPYTKALLSAVPDPSVGETKKERRLLKGELSSPINPKPGCRFAGRCIYAKEICAQIDPELSEVIPGHFVACHMVYEINSLEHARKH